MSRRSTCYSHPGLSGPPPSLHPIPALMNKAHSIIRSLGRGEVTNMFRFLLSAAVAERIREGDILLFGDFQNGRGADMRKVTMEELICTCKLYRHSD